MIRVSTPVDIRLKDEPIFQAWKVTERNIHQVASWCGGWVVVSGNAIVLHGHDDRREYAAVDSYVIKGITGYFRAVDHDYYVANYEVCESR